MPPPPSLTVNTLPPQSLPPLTRIEPRAASVLQSITPPTKKIHTDEDLLKWKNSKAYAEIVLFVGRLGEAAVGKPTRNFGSHDESTRSSQLADGSSHKRAVQAVVSLLETLHRWTQEIRPEDTPQRFGNLAFRTWGARLEEQVHDLHLQLLADRPHLHPFITELYPYLLDSFGSFVRIDYGSGHEVSFAAWLGLLFKLGFFDDEDVEPKAGAAESRVVTGSPQEPTEVESSLALEVFPLYLQVVWELQDRYALEPAGSHGVWGLDDYHFIPYIIGAAQLRQQILYHPSHFSSRSHKPANRLSPAQLLVYLPSASGANLAHSAASPTSAPTPSEPGAPFPNLLTSSIARIHSLKSGPFHEHSPLLYDISTSVPNWLKVSKGMLRMWEVEVLGKKPVVQHFAFGGAGWIWEGGKGAGGPVERVEQGGEGNEKGREATGSPMARPPPPTQAPWAAGSTVSSTSTPGAVSHTSSTTFPHRTLPSLDKAGTTRIGPGQGQRLGSQSTSQLPTVPTSTFVSGTAAPWATGGTSAPWAQAQAGRKE